MSLAAMVSTLEGTLLRSISAPGTGETPTTSIVCNVCCARAIPGATVQVRTSALLSAFSLVKTSPQTHVDRDGRDRPAPARNRSNYALAVVEVLLSPLRCRNEQF